MPPDGTPPASGSQGHAPPAPTPSGAPLASSPRAEVPEEISVLTIVLVSLFSAACGVVAGFLLGRPGVLSSPLSVALLVGGGAGMLLGERLGDDCREQVLYGFAGALLGAAGAAGSVFFHGGLDRLIDRILGSG